MGRVQGAPRGVWRLCRGLNGTRGCRWCAAGGPRGCVGVGVGGGGVCRGACRCTVGAAGVPRVCRGCAAGAPRVCHGCAVGSVSACAFGVPLGVHVQVKLCGKLWNYVATLSLKGKAAEQKPLVAIAVV